LSKTGGDLLFRMGSDDSWLCRLDRMDNFRSIDRQTGYLLPPSVDEWLPERHLARFVVEVIDGFDLGRMSGAYRGSGSASYHPRMLLGLLVYGYATGVFSSRKLERSTYDSVAFRFVAANDHPDHDTIATFRRRFLKDIEKLFVDVLKLAREMGVLKMGTIGLDGTKLHANASRHSALSYEHASKIEAQLKAEVADLMAKAEAADAADIPDGMSIPDELARREDRLRKIAEAKAKIAARAKERHAREKAEHEAKMAARAAKTAATGKKPRGKPPAPPAEGPRPSDQVNLTDEDSRIMPTAGGGFEQSYNAQAAVAAGGLLVVASDVVQAPNDKNQVEPMLEKIAALPEDLGEAEHLLADAGYFSASNVEACVKAGVEPVIAMGRQPHHPPLSERFEKAPEAPKEATPVEAMAYKLKTPTGRALYALRKQTPEPVFGIIKSVLGFRQFSLRGLEKVRGEWSLVTMAWNLKRMFALAPA
jgi:transposase